MSGGVMSEGLVRRHPRLGAGYAELRLPGAAAAVADPRLRLFWENHHAPYLGPQGWQPAEAVLHPEEAAAEGEDLVLALGPEICNHLETDTYEVILPGLGNRRFVVPWVEIPRRALAGRATVGAQPRAPLVAAAPPEEKPVAKPVQEEPPPKTGGDQSRMGSDPPPLEETRPRPPWLLILLALLVVAGGAGAAWHFWPRPQPVAELPAVQPAPAEPAPAPGTAPSTATAPTAEQLCRGDGPPLGQQSARAIAGRADCPPGEYFGIATAMREAGRHDDALLMLELAAEKGSAPAMLRLAQLYDPASFRAGEALEAADPRQAARYYRDAERAGEAGAAAPRAALKTLLQQQADQGDPLAKLTIEDFWP